MNKNMILQRLLIISLFLNGKMQLSRSMVLISASAKDLKNIAENIFTPETSDRIFKMLKELTNLEGFLEDRQSNGRPDNEPHKYKNINEAIKKMLPLFKDVQKITINNGNKGKKRNKPILRELPEMIVTAQEYDNNNNTEQKPYIVDPSEIIINATTDVLKEMDRKLSKYEKVNAQIPLKSFPENKFANVEVQGKTNKNRPIHERDKKKSHHETRDIPEIKVFTQSEEVELPKQNKDEIKPRQKNILRDNHEKKVVTTDQEQMNEKPQRHEKHSTKRHKNIVKFSDENNERDRPRHERDKSLQQKNILREKKERKLVKTDEGHEAINEKRPTYDADKYTQQNSNVKDIHEEAQAKMNEKRQRYERDKSELHKNYLRDNKERNIGTTDDVREMISDKRNTVTHIPKGALVKTDDNRKIINERPRYDEYNTKIRQKQNVIIDLSDPQTAITTQYQEEIDQKWLKYEKDIANADMETGANRKNFSPNTRKRNTIRIRSYSPLPREEYGPIKSIYILDSLNQRRDEKCETTTHKFSSVKTVTTPGRDKVLATSGDRLLTRRAVETAWWQKPMIHLV